MTEGSEHSQRALVLPHHTASSVTEKYATSDSSSATEVLGELLCLLKHQNKPAADQSRVALAISPFLESSYLLGKRDQSLISQPSA